MVLDKTWLAHQVQRNCHIADARHGTDFGLCTYLMKMREYFRWEQGLSYSAILDKDAVGDWLSDREKLWKDLQDEDFSEIKIDSVFYDPFDAENINKIIRGLEQQKILQLFLEEI